MKPDVVVVGAGIGGMCAAIVAASHGLSVQVVEAASEVGGKAGRQQSDGVWFDTGPSVLTLPHLVDAVFQAAGTSLRSEVELIVAEPVFHYRYPDGVVLPVHFAPEDTLTSVQDVLGNEAANELESFLAYARDIWDAAAPNFVLAQAPTWLTLLDPAKLRSLPWIDPGRTMWGAIRGRVKSPHLRALLARYATYNGSDVRVAPATLNCIAHVELSMGCYGVKGGMFSLAEALKRVARTIGVQFAFDEPVVRVETDGEGVCGVVTRSRRYATRKVVVNADVAHLVTDLLDVPAPRRLTNAVTQPKSTSGWTAVFRARRRHDRVAHEVVFPRVYADEFVDMFDRNRAPQEPTVYLCAQEKAHQRPGWDADEPVFAMANTPAITELHPQPQDSLGDRVVARLHETGRIDRADRVVWQRSARQLALRFPRSGGGLYGSASNSPLSAFRRPPNRVSSLPGLYLASGSAHPGGGVPMVAQSGMLAGTALIEDSTRLASAAPGGTRTKP